MHFFQKVWELSEEDLHSRIITAFTGRDDPKFMPNDGTEEIVWDRSNDYYNIAGVNHSGIQPGTFFAEIYSTRSGAGEKHGPPQKYRDRFERVMERIMFDCLDHEGSVTQREEMIAYFSVQAASHINLWNGPDAIIHRIEELSKKAKVIKLTEDEVSQLEARVESTGENRLCRLGALIERDQRYSHINFDYTNFAYQFKLPL